MTPLDPGDAVRDEQAIGDGAIGIRGGEALVSDINRTSSEVEHWKTGATRPCYSQGLFPVLPGDAYPFTRVIEPVEADVEVVKQRRAKGAVPAEAEVMSKTRLKKVRIERGLKGGYTI